MNPRSSAVPRMGLWLRKDETLRLGMETFVNFNSPDYLYHLSLEK